MNKSILDIYIELYKRKAFDKIPIGKYPDGSFFYMTDKQVRAMQLLSDNETTFVGYGGSARSGKSIIETTAIIFDCLAYPGIAWGLARKELTVLKKTVLITLFKQLEFYGLTSEDYHHNSTSNRIKFNNKFEVFLIDTAYKPSDPLNTRFGGFELTRVAIDESNETDVSVIIKLFERTGWRLNDTYNLKRKQFECFNPAKNHVYSRFYKPFRDNNEDLYKKFIPALPGDNPHPSVQEWIDDILKTGDQITIQRQIYGNFDYDDDPSLLVDYDAVCDMFTNTHVNGGLKRISADLAMQGRDRFVAGEWDGNICKVAIDKEKATGKEIETDLNYLKTKKRIGNTNIIADSDGLGNYLESYIRNITQFRGGARASNPDVYYNLKSECAWNLAKAINTRDIYIICSKEQEDRIKEEVSICLKRSNIDNDLQKKRIIPKEKMKEFLGRSPDYLDMLLMGMMQPKRTRKGQRVL